MGQKCIENCTDRKARSETAWEPMWTQQQPKDYSRDNTSTNQLKRQRWLEPMSKSKRMLVNENYIHACDYERVAIADHFAPLSHAGYTDSELASIYDFYVSQAPICKAQMNQNGNLKSLAGLGWRGTTGEQSLPALERKLLRVSDMPMLCLVKGASIKDTLGQWNLRDSICTVHPRCVMQWNARVELMEDGSTRVSVNETRMECLFRHIRNSLAHSLTFVFSSGTILLEDRGADQNHVTARILLKKQTLLDWMSVVLGESGEA